MITATINRDSSTDHGTFGTFSITRGGDWNRLTLQSLELPWRDNAINVSCIPCGIYTCEFAWSTKRLRFVYWVRDVLPRTSIQMHSANYAGDVTQGFKSNVKGCIALGMTRGYGWGEYSHQRIVGYSADAFRALIGFTNKQPFKLIIAGG